MHASFLPLVPVCLLHGILLPAALGADNGSTLSFYLENDVVSRSDDNYTNGLKFGWSSPDLQQLRDTPYANPLLPLFDLLPFINDRNYQKNLVLSLGQNIYTPSSTATSALVEDDRPYAGWLYLGVGVVWKDARVRNSLVLDLGVVGPWSFAEESQAIIHEASNMTSPRGWDNQLGNEVGFTLAYERTWRWPGRRQDGEYGWELLPFAGLAAGTVRTSASVGSEFRWGRNLPDDFGTAAIGPVATTSTPVNGSTPVAGREFGYYLFARVDGSAVARNIFLDGNTFTESHSVDRRIFVADLSAGIAFNYKNTKVAYAFVYRTREFDGQDEAQIFGTLSLNWEL